MTRWMAMAVAAMLAFGCAPRKAPESLGYDDLPDPAIELTHTIRPGETPLTHMAPTHGVVDIRLSESDPIFEIWNDPQTRQDPWGTILLENVKADGTVVARIREKELSAEVGDAFPGTGIVVIKSDPELQSAVLRSKWTLTETQAQPN